MFDQTAPTDAPRIRRRADGTAPVRPGAVAFALAFGLLNLAWLLKIDVVIHIGVVTKMTLIYHGVFSCALLAVLNLAIKRLAPRLAFTGAELVLIYCVMFLACSVAGLDFMQMLIPSMTHPFWYGSPENHWEDLFFKELPRHLTVSDEHVLTRLYEGGSTVFDRDNAAPFLVPCLWWTGLVMVLVFMATCLNVLVRRCWTDREKLSFPLIEMPLEFSTQTLPLLRNRIMWVGFALALGIDLLAGLHYLYPAVPAIDIRSYRPRRLFYARPWNAIGPLEIGANPFVVGLGFFLPLEVLFSCWFFFVFTKVQLVFCSVIGYADDRRMPYLPQQTFGAYLAIVGLIGWNARAYWRQVGRVIRGLPAELNDAEEPLRYRTAAGGLLVGMILILAFCSYAGMSVAYALYFFAVYFATSLTLTRIRAEVGPPAHDLPYASPGEILAGLANPHAFRRRDLTMSALMLWFTRGYRTHPMPVQLESFKLADRTGSSQRTFMWVTLLTALLAGLATYWVSLYFYFRYGEGTAVIRGEARAFGNLAYNTLTRWLRAPDKPDVRSLWFIVGGVLFTLLLNGGKTRYPWWPLLPVGYALQGGWMMRHIWVGLLTVWAIKRVLLRYGGGTAYRRARPFFLGLVLGEFSMASLWSLVTIIWGIPTYSFWS